MFALQQNQLAALQPDCPGTSCSGTNQTGEHLCAGYQGETEPGWHEALQLCVVLSWELGSPQVLLFSLPRDATKKQKGTGRIKACIQAYFTSSV